MFVYDEILYNLNLTLQNFYFAEIQDYFLKILEQEKDVSAGVAAIRTLLKVLEQYNGNIILKLNKHKLLCTLTDVRHILD